MYDNLITLNNWYLHIYWIYLHKLLNYWYLHIYTADNVLTMLEFHRIHILYNNYIHELIKEALILNRNIQQQKMTVHNNRKFWRAIFLSELTRIVQLFQTVHRYGSLSWFRRNKEESNRWNFSKLKILKPWLTFVSHIFSNCSVRIGSSFRHFLNQVWIHSESESPK